MTSGSLVEARVLVAVTGADEPALVEGLDRSGLGLRVTRRCADLTELLAAARAGLGTAAVVSADLYRFGPEAVADLHASAVAVVVLVAGEPVAVPAPPGVDAELPAGSGPAEVAAAVAACLPRPGRPPAAVAPGLPDGGPLVDGPLVDGPLDDGPLDDGGLPAGGRHRPLSPEPARPSGALPPAVPLQLPPAWRPADPADALSRRAPAVRAEEPPPGGDGEPRGSGRVVAVWGPVGSPGRTTVAVNLATELARQGQQVLLADADTYGASVAAVMGLPGEGAGFAAAVRSATHATLTPQRLTEFATPTDAAGPHVLTGLTRADRWPELRPAGLRAVWEMCRRVTPWTVVDTGFSLERDEELTFDTPAPRRNAATLSALEAADVVVAVGSGDPIGLQRLMRGLVALADVTGPQVRPLVVVTRVRASALGSHPQSRVRDLLHRHASVTDVVCVPDDRPALDAALLAGRALADVAPGSAARAPLRELAGRLVAEHGRAPAAAPRRRFLGRRRAATGS